MSTELKMFASLPSSYLPEVRRQSMGRLFGSCLQEVRKNADLSVEGAARLADAIEVSFDKISTLVVLCRAAWEL